MSTCPICGSKAGELPKTGDAEGYDCPRHGRFKVSESVLRSEPRPGIGQSHWENALKTAKDRVASGETPLITTYDF